jgi:hypothetical protein
MDYVTVETIGYCVNSYRLARYRLTYEVKPLRDGLASWFLVAMEELTESSTPAAA